MDNRTTAVESISFLSRAESRVCLMECLLEVGPVDQQALQRRLDHSRSTVTRSLDSLSEVGWVTETAEGYQLTPVGRLVISEFQELLSAVDHQGSIRTGARESGKATNAVSKAIRRAIDVIAMEHEDLSRHLKALIRRGYNVSYEPVEPISWQTN